MNPFYAGFSDELEKLAAGGLVGAAKSIGKLLIKHPGKALTTAFVGAGGIAGAKAARRTRRIAASSRGPSKAWYVDYNKAVGLPKRLTRVQEERMSRHFAPYRGKK